MLFIIFSVSFLINFIGFFRDNSLLKKGEKRQATFYERRVLVGKEMFFIE